jgi:hypothetical protein
LRSANDSLLLELLRQLSLLDFQVEASPFGAPTRDEWSLPALGLGALALAFLEPDPAVKWTAERIAAVRQGLATLSVPG